MKKLFLILFTLIAVSQLRSENLTWSSSVVISDAGVSAATPPEPRIAVDSSGNTFVTWIETGTVKFKSKPFGGSWSSSITVATSSSNPRLYVDPSGNATVLWIQSGSVKAATKPFGMSFGGTTSLTLSGSSSADIAGDASGNAVAIWVSAGSIQSKTKLFGGIWAVLPDTLSLLSGSDMPIIAVGSNGRVIATWHTVVSSVDTIFSATKTMGGLGLWGTATTISNPARNSINQHVAVDGSGNAVAIWYIYEKTGSAYSNVIAQSAYKANAGSWTSPVGLSDPGYYNPTNPLRMRARVGIDGSGNPVALWTNSYDGSTFTIQSSARSTDGSGTWSIPVNLVETNKFAFFDDISIPASRDSFATYMMFDGVFANVQTNVGNVDTINGLHYSTPEQISPQRSGFPRNSAAATGNNLYAGTVWLNTDGTNVFVMAATASGTLLQPPSGLAVMQNANDYGIHTEYVNTLSWTASSSPNIVFYQIFRNGSYISTVDGSTLSYDDRNQTQNGAVTYSIASTDDKGTQSFQASVNFP